MADPVPSLYTLPDAPNPALGEEDFNAKAYPWSIALVPFGSSLEALGDNVFANAEIAETAATDAETASGIAVSSANYKGRWADLTGALNTPAAVFHDGSVWLLAVDLADVTASEPGVSGDWDELVAGSGMTNPMTTAGDIIIGGASGAPARLAAGTNDQVLTIVAGVPAWADAAGGGSVTDPEVQYTDLGNVAVSGSETVDIDMSSDPGNYFIMSMESSDTSGTLTLTASNTPADAFDVIIVIRRAGRKSIALPNGWKWSQGSTPTLVGTSGFYTKLHVSREPWFGTDRALVKVVAQETVPTTAA